MATNADYTELDEINQLRSEVAGLLDVIGGAGHRARELDLDSWQRRSAENLLHYVAFRDRDLRPLQDRLAKLGLSSLGRSEAHVAATLGAVSAALQALAGGRSAAPAAANVPVGFEEGRTRLAENARALLGRQPDRGAAIMVTLPSEAAERPDLVQSMVDAGMDAARINCAHDDEAAWSRMVQNVRAAARTAQRRVPILMDLPGPKLRTGAVAPGVPVLKLRPERDALGRVVKAARARLVAAGAAAVPGGLPAIPIAPGFLRSLSVGSRVRLVDAREADRVFVVTDVDDAGATVETAKTIYLTPGLHLRSEREGDGDRDASDAARTEVGALPAEPGEILLKRGDLLVLTRAETPGIPATRDAQGACVEPARIPCTLPEVFRFVQPGARIFFDDGKIGGVVRSASEEELRVEIIGVPAKGRSLGADKGINLPDSTLEIPALTARDEQALAFAAANADLVGLSFVHSEADVRLLQDRLEGLSAAADIGIVLKIETRTAFERLPEILLAALSSARVGVMIARGDLAVECGWERLAEIQEEILWICEAAHVPVIWATQVLETLAKTGMPSRAEITDAAMAARAECVMLNKGPHVLDAMRVLGDILTRMGGHQSKKSAMLRPLRSWHRDPRPRG